MKPRPFENVTCSVCSLEYARIKQYRANDSKRCSKCRNRVYNQTKLEKMRREREQEAFAAKVATKAAEIALVPVGCSRGGRKTAMAMLPCSRCATKFASSTREVGRIEICPSCALETIPAYAVRA